MGVLQHLIPEMSPFRNASEALEQNVSLDISLKCGWLGDPYGWVEESGML